MHQKHLLLLLHSQGGEGNKRTGRQRQKEAQGGRAKTKIQQSRVCLQEEEAWNWQGFSVRLQEGISTEQRSYRGQNQGLQAEREALQILSSAMQNYSMLSTPMVIAGYKIQTRSKYSREVLQSWAGRERKRGRKEREKAEMELVVLH